MNIAWSAEDFDHGGPIVMYQINLTSQTLQKSRVIEYNAENNIDNHMSTKIVLGRLAEDIEWLPNCENQSANTNLYNFSIRAVTIDKQTDQIFHSPWSLQEVVPAYCYSKSPKNVFQTLIEF